MATKKTKKRRTSPVSSGGTTRRRKGGKRRRGLSEGGGKSLANRLMQAGKNNLSSNLGGAGAAMINKMLPATSGKPMRLATGFLGALALSVFGFPNMAAGFNGGMTALAFQGGFLSEDGETQYADPATLEEMPIYLDENDTPMVLEEGGNFRYLEDNEIQQLAESGQLEILE